jgi:hypothetical protein
MLISYNQVQCSSGVGSVALLVMCGVCGLIKRCVRFGVCWRFAGADFDWMVLTVLVGPVGLMSCRWSAGLCVRCQCGGVHCSLSLLRINLLTSITLYLAGLCGVWFTQV